MSLGTTGGVELSLRSPDGEPLPTPSAPSSGAASQIATDPREVDTADKLVFCALSDGSLEAFDLGSKLSVHRTAISSRALNAVTYSPSHNLVAAGSSDGIVTIFDTRALATPVTSFTRNSSSIEDLSFTKNTDHGSDDVGIVITTEDGLPYIAGIRPEGPMVLSELVGSDCDALRVVRVAPSGDIWTAGDDGIVRRY
jgi:proteasomal ATPase-associated factor 1